MKFVEYNNNPKKKKAGDCVVRAVALALDKSWVRVYNELAELGLVECRMINEPALYEKYLSNLGIKKQKMPRRDDNTRYTVREFANELAHPDTTYLISVAKHLTVVKNRDLYDTWDCSYKSVGNYWIINQ